MADVTLHVNGRAFGGWKSARVTRGIEAISGSFELDVSDRWGGQREPWPILEEDECALALDGVPVITGFVDRRSLSYGASEHSLSVTGRDRTGALVDCSAELKQWEFRNVPLLTLAKRLAEPFGVAVSLQPGLKLSASIAKISVDPGDTAHDAIERACRMVGLLPMADGVGGLVLARAGATRATTALIEGENIKTAAADYDGSGRFRRYVASGQHAGSDNLSGAAAARVRAEAQDVNVRRVSRVLVIRPEGNATQAYARQRAEWEATVRAARAASVRVTVQGWQQGDGSLWPINALVPVSSPRLGLKGDMLITQATYSLDENGGTTTTLQLKRPDAFLPEPAVPQGREPGRATFAPAPVTSEEPDNMSVWVPEGQS